MSSTSTSTSDMYDQYGEGLGVCDLQFRQYGGVRAFRGAAVTLLCEEDNLLLKEVIREAGDGRVLVVDTAGSLRVAMLGDNMAATAAENGWAGFVVHGAVRDAAALRRLPVGVTALGTNPRRSFKLGHGERDVPVTFGSVVFRPGALVVSDEDGVAVLPG